LLINRVHDAANLAKFACQISPAVRPGEAAEFGYYCDGGQFVYDHYWRQSITRLTDLFDLRLRHREAKGLLGCTATEEGEDGAEISATDALSWSLDLTDAVVSLTRRALTPNQAVTLRWEVQNDRV
jgi:hypothetical protein